jgi:hypothetical protein
MSERIQKLVAELRRRFEGLYGPRLVRLMLYGSQARVDAKHPAPTLMCSSCWKVSCVQERRSGEWER